MDFKLNAEISFSPSIETRVPSLKWYNYDTFFRIFFSFSLRSCEVSCSFEMEWASWSKPSNRVNFRPRICTVFSVKYCHFKWKIRATSRYMYTILRGSLNNFSHYIGSHYLIRSKYARAYWSWNYSLLMWDLQFPPIAYIQ